jgi:hypothetical protein
MIVKVLLMNDISEHKTNRTFSLGTYTVQSGNLCSSQITADKIRKAQMSTKQS